MTWLWASEFRALREQFTDALQATEQARLLDPLSSYCQQQHGAYLCFLNRADEVIALLTAVIEREPDYAAAYYDLGWAYTIAGKHVEAIAAHDQAIHYSGGADFFLSQKAGSLAAAGRIAEVRQIYDELLTRSRSRWVDPFALHCTAVAIGDADAAIAHLEQGERDRSFFFLWFRACLEQPGWIALNLREQPRVHAMLYRIWPADFPQYASIAARPDQRTPRAIAT